MALNQTNKLVWIVETIYRVHKISFEELNRRWMDNVDLSGGEEMLKRTFHKWKWNIFDTFGLSIECEKTAPYRYYIANENDMKSGSIGNWLLSTLSVSNFLLESKSIKTGLSLKTCPVVGNIWSSSLMQWRRIASFTSPILPTGKEARTIITWCHCA